MIRYNKGDPHAHITAYRDSQALKTGPDIAFFYLPMCITVARVPTVAREAPFVIKETAKDYQKVEVQGMLIHRIADSAKAARCLDVTVKTDYLEFNVRVK